jgi:hypothetical protein
MTGRKSPQKPFFRRILAVWEGKQGAANRNLRGFPNMPRLPWPFPVTPPAAERLARPIVISSMTDSRCRLAAQGFSGTWVDRQGSPPFRHGTCSSFLWLEKNSQPVRESVNFCHRSAKPSVNDRRWCRRNDAVDWTRSVPQHGWKQGATGNGYRKRTRVRVACGGAIRSCGEGIHSSHGHFGRSVVGRKGPAPLVQQPEREAPRRLRHLSRGPGLPAALTRSPVGFVRMPALAGRTASATRPRSPVVTRAASRPAPPAGTSGGWPRRTRPDPRTRLRTV